MGAGGFCEGLDTIDDRAQLLGFDPIGQLIEVGPPTANDDEGCAMKPQPAQQSSTDGGS